MLKNFLQTLLKKHLRQLNLIAPPRGDLSMMRSNTKWLINLKKWITVVSHFEKFESAVIDIDVDLSSLDETELYETLFDFEIENEIDWKLESSSHAIPKNGSTPTDSDWIKDK